MNNMNGIISECKHIFNDELDIKDTKNGSTRAATFYSNVKARIAEENAKRDSIESKDNSSRIVTGEELRRYFDRNYDMESYRANSIDGNINPNDNEKRQDSSVRDER